MKKILMFFIVPLYIVYIITTFSMPKTSSVISAIYVFTIAFFILLESKTIVALKKTWYLFALATFSWAITDTLWAFHEVYKGNVVEELSIFTYLYMITDIILLMIISIYFLENIKKWNRLQLLIDTIVITLITFALGSALFYSEIEFSLLSLEEWVGTVGYLTVDIIIMIFVVTMIASSRFRKVRTSIKFMATGLVIYVIADLMFIDTVFTGKEIFGVISDILFYGAFLLFAFSSYHANKDPKDYYHNVEKMPLNYGKSYILWWVLIVPLILFVFGRISITYMASILFVLVVYQLLSHYVQKLLLTESLYHKEHEITQHLEERIKERTVQLEQSKKELEKRAITDSLTQLYNREYFHEYLEKKIKEKIPFSIAYMDLDRFKVINDLHGHPMGDRVLVEVSKRLHNISKSGYPVFRVGGDEFSMIIESVELVELESISRLIKGLITQPIEFEHYKFNVDASIGFARYPNDAQSMSDLVKNADIAMYHAKAKGITAKHVVFSSDLIEQLERRNHLEILLKNADFKKDFDLYYQPQFDIESGQMVGMEALIRWHHKDEGFISPAEFIPLAEEIGLIPQVNDFVFTEAMLQIGRWNDHYDKNLVMSVNLSPLTFNSVDFYESLKSLIDITGVNPSFIEFEITEHSAMNSSQTMEDLFKEIKTLGFSISIDDFGTGYSSLSYLKRFNVDTLKIAKELIFNIETNEDEMMIVEAIIMMSEALKLHIIAEGVERKEQLDLLRRANCHTVQGYYFEKPIPAHVLEDKYFRKSSK